MLLLLLDALHGAHAADVDEATRAAADAGRGREGIGLALAVPGAAALGIGWAMTTSQLTSGSRYDDFVTYTTAPTLVHGATAVNAGMLLAWTAGASTTRR